MSLAPSHKTLLARAKRELKELRSWQIAARRDIEVYRGRAIKAEQELADWKNRFDELLRAFNKGEQP